MAFGERAAKGERVRKRLFSLHSQKRMTPTSFNVSLGVVILCLALSLFIYGIDRDVGKPVANNSNNSNNKPERKLLDLSTADAILPSQVSPFLKDYLSHLDDMHGKPLMVLYNLESCENGVFVVLSGSTDMCVNNIKIFVSSILNRTKISKAHNAAVPHPPVLFIFVGTKKAATKLIPMHLPNVVFVQEQSPELSDFHFRLVATSIEADLLKQFNTIFFLSKNMRGPFRLNSDDEWLLQFRDLMTSHNIGLMGNTLTCETPKPSVQLDAFAIRGDLIDMLVTAFRSGNIEIRLSEEMRQAKYNISSYLDYSTGRPWFKGVCLTTKTPHPYEPRVFIDNPTYWCNLPDKMNFLTWRVAGSGAMMNLVSDQ